MLTNTQKRTCGEPEIPVNHCTGCTDPKSEGTHQGCTIEHGHIGCSKIDSLTPPVEGKKCEHENGKGCLACYKSTPPTESWEKEWDGFFCDRCSSDIEHEKSKCYAEMSPTCLMGRTFIRTLLKEQTLKAYNEGVRAGKDTIINLINKHE